MQTIFGESKTAPINNLELLRKIKRDLVRMRKEIDTTPNEGEKARTLKAYAELLTSLEIDSLNSPRSRERRIS